MADADLFDFLRWPELGLIASIVGGPCTADFGHARDILRFSDREGLALEP